jgi:hypothetical protein
MAIMSPKQKENLSAAMLNLFRWTTLGLLSVMMYFLIDIHNKVNQSHEFRMQQVEMNKTMMMRLDWIMEAHRKMDLDLDKLTERQYLLESRVNRKRDVNNN